MLKVAGQLGCYRNLSEGLLTEKEKFPFEDSSYDGILCAGCFTVGKCWNYPEYNSLSGNFKRHRKSDTPGENFTYPQSFLVKFSKEGPG